MKTLPVPAVASRRRAMRLALGSAAATLVWPLLPARAATLLPPVAEGPFYPSPAWRERGPFAGDWDADLTRVQRGGRERVAEGEHLGLDLVLRDSAGRPLDGATVEIWQCDTWGRYRHPRDGASPGDVDEGFQGFGQARSRVDGAVAFRTIRPAPYVGRTPHIHVKLRHPSFGEVSSQLFVDGDPGNTRDFLWRRLEPAERAALAMRLQTAHPSSGLRWQVRHTLVVPT
ncbi:MAG: intradiol ring-cleavage dioxygenase [Rubrivivax sp.]